MKSIKKYLFFFAIITLLGCSERGKDEKVISDQNFGEQKSTHESEWEEHSNQDNNDVESANYEIVIKESKTITEKSASSFINPKFTNNGKYLVFTNENYGQIWVYEVFKKTLRKVVELPQCGFRYQIAGNNEEIFYRNKAAKGNEKEQIYSIFKYSISKDNTELVYDTESRISQPLLVGNSLYFLENKQPKALNLENKSLDTKFDFPYFYVQNDLLIRAAATQDTLKYAKKDYRFISCEYSKDREVVFVLTANNGTLILNLNGEIINQYKNAVVINKLYKSNLIVFTEEKDDGMKILSSNLKFGFLNSANKISLPTDFSSKIFNPDWSPIDNKLTYSSDNGMINILSFNIEKLTQ